MGLWDEQVTTDMEGTKNITEPLNNNSIFTKKRYRIFFTNGKTYDIEAENDFSDDYFVDDYPMLVLYNGNKKNPNIVATFNLDQIAGFCVIDGFSTDDWDMD